MRVASSVSARDEENCDLLIYMLWSTGTMTNSKIGELFGITYSSVSHSVKSTKSKLAKNRNLKNEYSSINSLFMM
jgi:hypothetical protein